MIYTNGKIYTFDENNSVVESVAILEGKIVDLGNTAEIMEKYSVENIVDLEGKVVLPGFIDSEGSLIEFSKNLNILNLTFATSLDEIKTLVEEKIRATRDGKWIGGYGWNELNITDEELIAMDRSTLDEIAPHHNVYLINLAANTVWCNTKLLETLQITKETPSPEGGEIEKDDNGVPTGLLYDAALNIVKDKLPELTKEEVLESVEKGSKELLKYGITEIHDRTVGGNAIDLFKELIDKGKLPVRVYAILTGNEETFDEYLKKGIEVDYKNKLTVRAVSLDYDGSFIIQDAAMRDDYFEEPLRKIPYSDEYDIEEVFKKAYDKNFQFMIKAVGDRAVNSSLNAIEKVLKEKNENDHRTVLEHVEFIERPDLDRIKSLKIIPSVRPDICMEDMYIVSERIIPDNVNELGLWSSLIQTAGMITTGSDFPFHQINPFIQIYYLTTRQYTDTLIADVPNADQKISLIDAIKSYTVWAAYSSFEENIKGTLEEGKFADMIVISNDIFNSDSKALLDTKVLKTIINGEIVYDYEGEKIPAGK
jgi:predicted amidohydrolase YtcJ